ncbi:MAG: hypothetical protein J6S92_05485, partial [Oscillospiraceae bacterium]|nr:hypothetical protein [Oscillospiraceae bacterium]
DQFVQAVSVSGDTVVLPSKALWDMNELYPEGVSGDIPINCTKIIGNETEVRNLHLLGKFIVPAACQFDDLYMKNVVCEGTSFFYNNGNTRDIQMNGCIMTGLFGVNTQYFVSSGLDANRTTINLDMTAGGSNEVRISDRISSQYCRLSAVYPSNAGGTFVLGADYGDVKFCKLSINYLGCRAFDSSPFSGCVVTGNFGSAYDVNEYGYHGNFVSVYDETAFSSEFTTPNAYFKAVTHAQLYDAEYLASIGFPIGA